MESQRDEPKEPSTFELTAQQRQAIQTLAGDRKVKLDGRIEQGKVRIVGIQILPMGACNSAFDPVE